MTDTGKERRADSTASAGAGGPAVGAEVRVDSLKYDGRLHRSWPARLARRDGTLVVVEGVFEAEVRHGLLGTIASGTHSTEYYWTDRWYSVLRFREPGGALRNYYCNINRPAQFDGRVLTFVDLDIDLLVSPDFTYAVLDEEEFAVNAERLGYTADIFRRVAEARAGLVRLIEARAFPFDEAN